MAATGVIDAFTLPSHLEAAEPPEARGLRRDEVRLLVSRIDTDSIAHSRFSELPRWLAAGDLLVVNTSGTLNAALVARARDGDRFEVHLSTKLPGNLWAIEVRRPGPVASLPYRNARAGTSSTAAVASRSSHRTRSSIGWTRTRGSGSRRWSWTNPFCRISNGLEARFDTATSTPRGRSRCTRPFSRLNQAAPRCHRPRARSRQNSSRDWSHAAFRSRRSCSIPVWRVSKITNRLTRSSIACRWRPPSASMRRRARAVA